MNSPHTTTDIDKTAAKTTESDILRGPSNVLSLVSALEAVVVRGNIAMVHAD